MNFEAWKSVGSYYDYHGNKICYWHDGADEEDLILLVHGFPTASWDWNKMWKHLRRKYALFAVDMIGFGFSDKPKQYKYSIMDQANLIEKILFENGITKVHILAHDYGDTVAQELLSRFNEREKIENDGLHIKSLCLLNGGLFPETHQPRLIQKLLISPVGRFLTSMLTKEKLRTNLSQIFGPDTQPTDAEIDEFYSLIIHNDGIEIMYKLIRYMKERTKHRERWVNSLIDTTVPIRVIDGGMDPVSGAHMVKRYHELITNPDAIILDKIGHYPQVEAPEKVLEHYLPFLDKYSVVGNKKEAKVEV